MSGDGDVRTLKQVTRQRGVPKSIGVDYGPDELWFLSLADALQKSGDPKAARGMQAEFAVGAWRIVF